MPTLNKLHKDIFIPKHVLNMMPEGMYEVEHTAHATWACANDHILPFSLPNMVELSNDTLIVVSMNKYHVVEQALYRVPYNERHDMVYSIGILNWPFRIITAWINRKHDDHDTLNEPLYMTEKEFETWIGGSDAR